VGVKYQTLAGWARKRRQRGQAKVISPVPPVAAARWLEAEVAGTPASAPLILHLPCGVRLEVADAKQAVLAARLIQLELLPRQRTSGADAPRLLTDCFNGSKLDLDFQLV
jgi:hypothetical protein